MKIVVKLILLLCLVQACTNVDDNAALSFDEPVKDISGSWQIVSVSRNGQDITEVFDFQDFRINFSADGTFTYENYVPFVTAQGGTWSLDDPQYPFTITFSSETSDPQEVPFSYPIVAGKRQIQLSFSTGCSSNIYAYTIERVE